MRDEGDERLAGEIVARKERADDRRGCRAPDGKAEKDSVVGCHVADIVLQRRFIARLPLALRLTYSLLVVFRIGRCRDDFEYVGAVGAAYLVGNDARVAGAAEVHDECG
jgi:hypothetical protein